MIITFRIQYRTTWGENLCVCINEENIVKLFTVDGYHWQGQTDYHPNPSVSFITYRYEVHREGRCIRKEFGIFPHQFYILSVQFGFLSYDLTLFRVFSSSFKQHPYHIPCLMSNERKRRTDIRHYRKL